MESFSYHHHHPFLVDSAYSPNTPIEMPIIQQEVGEITNLSSCFPYCYYYPFKATPELSTTDPSSSLDSARDFPSPQPTNMEKKRKNHSVTSLSSVQSKVTKEIKNKKQRKPSCGLKQTEEDKQTADDELEAIEASEELPGGYIHVRARRGQATDSHSLAERVRREKISERMKMLQDLVPGCDKVTGKALVLEEIINYVQSLQNQIEFLSMKLASFSPILHDMGEGYDDCMNQQERMGRIMPQPMPSHIQPITTVDNTANSYPMMGSSASLLLHGKVPTNFSQDEECFLVQVGEQRQGYFNSVGFNNNMCSFQ